MYIKNSTESRYLYNLDTLFDNTNPTLITRNNSTWKIDFNAIRLRRATLVQWIHQSQRNAKSFVRVMFESNALLMIAFMESNIGMYDIFFIWHNRKYLMARHQQLCTGSDCKRVDFEFDSHLGELVDFHCLSVYYTPSHVIVD